MWIYCTAMGEKLVNPHWIIGYIINLGLRHLKYTIKTQRLKVRSYFFETKYPN